MTAAEEYREMMRRVRHEIELWTGDKGGHIPLIPIVIEFIKRQKLGLICGEIDDKVDMLYEAADKLDKAIADGNLDAVMFQKARISDMLMDLKGLERILDREGPVGLKGEITEEMVERAREYPFEDLLPEGLTRGRCRCPIHSGANVMSFSVKNNRGKCFSCGWPNGKSGDTIQFLMDSQGLSFIEAVRRLT